MRIFPYFKLVCVLVFQLLIRGAIQLSCCYFQLDDHKVIIGSLQDRVM